MHKYTMIWSCENSAACPENQLTRLATMLLPVFGYGATYVTIDFKCDGMQGSSQKKNEGGGGGFVEKSSCHSTL